MERTRVRVAQRKHWLDKILNGGFYLESIMVVMWLTHSLATLEFTCSCPSFGNVSKIHFSNQVSVDFKWSVDVAGF